MCTWFKKKKSGTLWWIDENLLWQNKSVISFIRHTILHMHHPAAVYSFVCALYTRVPFHFYAILNKSMTYKRMGIYNSNVSVLYSCWTTMQTDIYRFLKPIFTLKKEKEKLLQNVPLMWQPLCCILPLMLSIQNMYRYFLLIITSSE